MSQSQKPILRSACLIAVTALGLAALTSVSAQQSQRSQAAASGLSGTTAVGQAQTPPALNPSHPDTYVVQPGDTLWDIASMFLRDPWYWPEIWQVNPQIENPHLIYPGDILRLSYLDNGSPVISLERGTSPAVRLSPHVRSEPIENAIPTIPYETLRAFLSRASVLAEDDLDSLPYIVANREGLASAAGNDVYVRNTSADVGETFSVVHQGEPLVDPDDDSVLGYEGIFVGEGVLRRAGDPATLHLTSSTREALVGDYLVATMETPPVSFLPRPPAGPVDGSIIAVVDGISLIGQYQVVILNRGARNGIEPGNVLQAYSKGQWIEDETRGARSKHEKVRLPDEPAGTIMVFSVFDRMSYALVMEATSEIEVYDSVRQP